MNKVINNPRIKGYIEGIIDGEGCLSLSHEKVFSGNKTYKPELNISNTYKSLIILLKSWIGGSISITKHKHHKVCYSLRLKSSAMRELLPKLKFLVKEKQRLLMLEALQILEERRYASGRWNPNYRIDELEKIYQKLRLLNGKQGGKK